MSPDLPDPHQDHVLSSLRTDPVSAVYGRALFELARDADMLEDLRDELRDFLALVASDEQVRVFVETPVLGDEEKTRVLEQALKDRVSDLTRKVILLLVQKGRERDLQRIVDHYSDLVEVAGGRITAELSAAREPSEELVEQVRSAIAEQTGMDVRLDVRTDPSLMGGILVRMGDQVVDNTVRRRLRQMVDRLRAVKLPADAGAKLDIEALKKA